MSETKVTKVIQQIAAVLAAEPAAEVLGGWKKELHVLVEHTGQTRLEAIAFLLDSLECMPGGDIDEALRRDVLALALRWALDAEKASMRGESADGLAERAARLLQAIPSLTAPRPVLNIPWAPPAPILHVGSERAFGLLNDACEVVEGEAQSDLARETRQAISAVIHERDHHAGRVAELLENGSRLKMHARAFAAFLPALRCTGCGWTGSPHAPRIDERGALCCPVCDHPTLVDPRDLDVSPGPAARRSMGDPCVRPPRVLAALREALAALARVNAIPGGPAATATARIVEAIEGLEGMAGGAGAGEAMTLIMRRVGPVETPRPSCAHAGDAGLDLPAAIRPGIRCRDASGTVVEREAYLHYVGETATLVLPAGASALVPTGWAVQIPQGFEGQVRPRSSGSERRVHVALGTIDSGFRGEVCATIWNFTGAPLPIRTGDRVAQLVIAPIVNADVEIVDGLEPSERGDAGWGSSGT